MSRFSFAKGEERSTSKPRQAKAEPSSRNTLGPNISDHDSTIRPFREHCQSNYPSSWTLKSVGLKLETIPKQQPLADSRNYDCTHNDSGCSTSAGVARPNPTNNRSTHGNANTDCHERKESPKKQTYTADRQGTPALVQGLQTPTISSLSIKKSPLLSPNRDLDLLTANASKSEDLEKDGFAFSTQKEHKQSLLGKHKAEKQKLVQLQEQIALLEAEKSQRRTCHKDMGLNQGQGASLNQLPRYSTTMLSPSPSPQPEAAREHEPRKEQQARNIQLDQQLGRTEFFPSQQTSTKDPSRKRTAKVTGEQKAKKAKIDISSSVEELKRITLRVGNIKLGTTDDEMRELFQGCDSYLAFWIQNRQKHNWFSYGFIDYESHCHAVKAMDALQGTNIRGEEIVIRLAQSSDNIKASRNEVDISNRAENTQAPTSSNREQNVQTATGALTSLQDDISSMVRGAVQKANHESMQQQQQIAQPRDDVYGSYDPSYLQNSGPNQHTTQPIVTGTSVVACKFKDGVVIAADNLASYGSLARFNPVHRLHSFSTNTLIGIGGDVSDMQHISRLLASLSTRENYYHTSSTSTTSLTAFNIHTYLSKVLYKRRSDMNPLWNVLLIAGFDGPESNKDSKPFLASADLLGTTFSSPTLASGFGAHLAQPILRKLIPDESVVENISREEAEKCVRECMKVLWYRDARSAESYSLGVVTREGIELLKDEKVEAQSWAFAEGVRGYGTQVN
ncbi:MAG: Proteasome subunit beta type-7 [Cirrosporium novae-zelandiae]|nr:MAG: Proteasome subunit beta type-7 [Cirrosporium novae-zelandiae]